MSRLTLEYTQAAIAHLQNIARYTEETWGEQQRESYLERLFAGLEQIRTSPTIGRMRDDIRLGLRSRRIEHHIVYYVVKKKVIFVAAVLHERMEPKKHL
jgi:toxin ParE1/3/4